MAFDMSDSEAFDIHQLEDKFRCRSLNASVIDIENRFDVGLLVVEDSLTSAPRLLSCGKHILVALSWPPSRSTATTKH